MGRQRRLADELGGVVAHLQSVDGDGSMMRPLSDVACSSEPWRPDPVGDQHRQPSC